MLVSSIYVHYKYIMPWKTQKFLDCNFNINKSAFTYPALVLQPYISDI